MQARVALSAMPLKKSGHNKFAGYQYFELGDFLPQAQGIFHGLGLAGVVSYSADRATLTITDTDDGSSIEIATPMADANLKGCHPIQNLGAVQTYIRRYLWVTAMEIVEHDALDATTGSDKPIKTAVPDKWSEGHEALLVNYRTAASNALEALKEFHASLTSSEYKTAVWAKHSEDLKKKAGA